MYIKNSRYIKRKIRRNKSFIKLSIIRGFALLLLLVLLLASRNFVHKNTYALPNQNIWEVRSVDTMKTSRDMARAELYNSDFDKKIEKEIEAIKDLGATHVAIGTPYDSEFLPYLKRWVRTARENNLNVWFRGGFSNYEGWFDYPKNLTPDQMLVKTQDFISTNPDLFENGDIFDPCPECENAGYFPQPSQDGSYNQFLIKKNNLLKDSFSKINKDVTYNWNSIIGGRAKEVVNKSTLTSLGNIVAIDHYAPQSSSYSEYLDYFKSQNSNVVISEFGAPIPDMHGNLTESEQTKFIESVLKIFYQNKNQVKGLNYWVGVRGTTAIFNPDYSLRSAAKVLKNYYSPAVVIGFVKNSAGDNLENVIVKTSDGLNSVNTNSDGLYQIVIPAGENNLVIEEENFNSENIKLDLKFNEEVVKDITLDPKKKDFIYNLRLKFKNIF